MGADAVTQELAYARRAWQELEELTTRPRQRQRAVQSWRFRYYAFKRKLTQELEQDTARAQVNAVQSQFDAIFDGAGELDTVPVVAQAQGRLSQAVQGLGALLSEGVVTEDNAREVALVARDVLGALQAREQEVAQVQARKSELEDAYSDALAQYQLEQDRVSKEQDAELEYDDRLDELVSDRVQEIVKASADRLVSAGYGTLGLTLRLDGVALVDENGLYKFVEQAWRDSLWWREVQEALDELGVDPRDYDSEDDLYKELLSAIRSKGGEVEDELVGIDEQAAERAEAELGPRPKAEVVTFEEPQRADYAPPRLGPKPSAPTWPALRPARGGLSDDLVSLLEEMDQYAYGAYTATYEHVAQINTLAAAIGHECPMLELVGDDLDLNALHGYLSEIESTWGDFAQGGAGNSPEGQAVISRFKDAVLAAQQARTLDELVAVKSEFSTALDRLYIWVTSKWHQFGGRPENFHKAKSFKTIRIKTAFGVISNKK